MTTVNGEGRSSRFTVRRLVSALAAVAVLVAAGAAFAYWTGTGSGTGQGAVGTSGTVTLTATVTNAVSPGNSSPVSFVAANATGAAVMVTTLHLVSVAVDAPHAACVTADFAMADVTQSHLVPAGATADALPVAGSLAYANTGVSQDACKGATLTLSLTST
jgi:hypothetical protein